MNAIVAEAPARAKNSKKATPAAPAVTSQQRAAAAGGQIQTGLQILAGAIASMDTEGSARTIAAHAQKLIQSLPLDSLASEATQQSADAVYDGLHLPLALIMGAIGADHESTSALDNAWKILDAAQNELDSSYMGELPKEAPAKTHWSLPTREAVRDLSLILWRAEQTGEYEGFPAQERVDAAISALNFMGDTPPQDLLWASCDASHALSLIRTVHDLLDLVPKQAGAADELNAAQLEAVPFVSKALQALMAILVEQGTADASPELLAFKVPELGPVPAAPDTDMAPMVQSVPTKSDGLTAEQLTLVLETIAGRVNTLRELIMVVNNPPAAGEHARQTCAEAAELLAVSIGAMADEAVGGWICGNANSWNYGPTFAAAGKAGAA